MFSEQPTRRFKRTLLDFMQSLPKGLKMKITLWRPETGEEWEITPVSFRQTKFQSSTVSCEVKV